MKLLPVYLKIIVTVIHLNISNYLTRYRTHSKLNRHVFVVGLYVLLDTRYWFYLNYLERHACAYRVNTECGFDSDQSTNFSIQSSSISETGTH